MRVCVYMYVYIYIYIYIYIYTYIVYSGREARVASPLPAGHLQPWPSLADGRRVRPIPQLRLSLLRFVDSESPRDSLWT